MTLKFCFLINVVLGVPMLCVKFELNLFFTQKWSKLKHICFNFEENLHWTKDTIHVYIPNSHSLIQCSHHLSLHCTALSELLVYGECCVPLDGTAVQTTAERTTRITSESAIHYHGDLELLLLQTFILLLAVQSVKSFNKAGKILEKFR